MHFTSDMDSLLLLLYDKLTGRFSAESIIKKGDQYFHLIALLNESAILLVKSILVVNHFSFGTEPQTNNLSL
jgi:hypothetical protein